jgi:hypothetical protein
MAPLSEAPLKKGAEVTLPLYQKAIPLPSAFSSVGYKKVLLTAWKLLFFTIRYIYLSELTANYGITEVADNTMDDLVGHMIFKSLFASYKQMIIAYKLTQESSKMHLLFPAAQLSWHLTSQATLR